jgi:hypothetical protein
VAEGTVGKLRAKASVKFVMTEHLREEVEEGRLEVDQRVETMGVYIGGARVKTALRVYERFPSLQRQ